MDAYNEAMRLYLAGKYWEASFAFGKVLSLFPNFHLNDKATWYLGNSYRFLYMNDIARQVYKEALEEYTTSEMRSKYLYGLQSLDYREGNYEEALKNHAFIINLYGESDIRPDADYLAGQIHFQRKNYNVAEQLLSGITPSDPDYLYAQYTLSIINIEDDKLQAAVQNLNNIIQDTTQEVADQLLQDAANTKLGHLYFEMGDKLRLAVEAYQRVPDGSPYQDEALLGTAWAWIKVNQPNVALKTIEKLISSYPESPLVPESFLVKPLQSFLDSNLEMIGKRIEHFGVNFAARFFFFLNTSQ
jgi:tetratricopeptide (TPR) repeat protein